MRITCCRAVVVLFCRRCDVANAKAKTQTNAKTNAATYPDTHHRKATGCGVVHRAIRKLPA